MTPDQKAMLERAGWTVVETGFWRSPLTGRAFSDTEALGVLALTAIRTRRGITIYSPRRRRCTR